jgi:hypothetical protein
MAKGAAMKTSSFGPGDEGKNSGNDDGIVNLRRRSMVRLYNPNGTYREFVRSDSISLPDEQGNWIDTDLVCNHFDDQGNPLPEDLKGVSVSHAGRLIPPGSLAVCTSQFHQSGLTRNIYIDVDGSVTEQGAICSTCLQRRTIFSIAAVAVGLCLAIGIIMGLWF